MACSLCPTSRYSNSSGSALTGSSGVGYTLHFWYTPSCHLSASPQGSRVVLFVVYQDGQVVVMEAVSCCQGQGVVVIASTATHTHTKLHITLHCTLLALLG
ncbi:hypothetical protein E2C01_015386 [Portunus trituberculatus]|uniref:Uncharacterized protein n=1 Tax=Portunus trituberculatus TaxID=210409 RepID=A0A5B7DMU8_PORTR|nr:hypothetical protein [Portunus trituberculatus]